MINKKGNAYLIIVFVVLLFIILFLGFMASMGSAIINWTFDVAVPQVSDLGVMGENGTNMTEWAGYTITPLNTVVQSFQWVVGVIYVLMLVACFGFAIAMRVTPSKWLIGFFFMCALLLIIGSIFISNMYENFYDDNSELATRLQEQSILSFMVLHSPPILTIVTLLTGIFLFSGLTDDEFA